MPSFFQKRSVRQITAAADLVCGDVVLTSDGYAGVVDPQSGIKSGKVGHVNIEGVVEFTKASASEVIAAGDRIQYNTSTKVASVLDFGTPASGSIIVGCAARASANGATSVFVDLNAGTVGSLSDPYTSVRNRRVRLTAAEINAGATLIPAPGAAWRLRLVDAKMIAIGGGAATATSVDILSTQSSSSVKLVAAAVAGLTQSAVLRAGATNSAVLADGASFVANDANAAITAAKTGSNLATATHVDFIVDYVIEPA